jgi:hypothetical protein
MSRLPARTWALATALALALAASPAFASAANSTGTGATDSSNGSEFLLASTPPGFDDLAQPREILVDVYFGGKRVGDAIATARPGFIQFRDPQKVASLIPHLSSPTDLGNALAGDLQSHADLVCGQMKSHDCGSLETGSPGVIFNEGRFRVDIFVPPAMLSEVPVSEQKFLDAPDSVPSLTSVVGLSLSGSSGDRTTYNVQNRTILAVGPGRLVSDLSYASRQGLVVDDLVAEMDRNQVRYSAGLFWAPGLDITGRRRIAGVGFGTQFDTRADRDALSGTPLVLFLSQPARVEFLIDGRLVGSRSYDAGNDVLDTSGLPDGSYPLVLQIHNADGTVREERRFFVKAPQIAPIAQPLYFGYVGMLANTRLDRPISLSDTLYYQVGTARRLSQAIAVDLSLIGTQHKQMVEAGAWLLNDIGQFRAAGLASADGDKAVLLQGNSSGRGRFNFSFDLRRVWSEDGRPLIPTATFIDSFAGGQPTGAQVGGSYTQASGSVGYVIGRAYLSVTGSLRKDADHRSDYSFGPSVTWPLLTRNGFQLTFQADGQRTRTTTAGFAGLRLVYTGKHVSVLGDAGLGSVHSRDHSVPSSTRMLGGLSANYIYSDSNRTDISAGAGIQRAPDSTVAHAGATAFTRYGNVRADILDSIEGSGAVQYGVALQTAIAVGGGTVGLGSRDLEDGAVIIAVDGQAGDALFDVFVNSMPYGHVRSGGQLPIHLQSYRSYQVRVRPPSGAPVSFDNGDQQVTLYPGTARVLRWTARSYFTAFGQAVGKDGRPIANAMVQAPHSIGETDDNGYFQIDTANGDRLKVTHGGDHCEIQVTAAKPANDFAPLGKVICQ